MSANQTPAWSAAHNGLPSDASAITVAGQVNQFLGTHAAGVLYQGRQILTPKVIYAATASPWNTPLGGGAGALDVDQPFTMSGTVIGRVRVPVLAVGQGADLLASLWTDNAGKPGTVICQTRIPASHLLQLAAVTGTAAAAPGAPITQLTGNPLAVAHLQAVGISDQMIEPYNYAALTFVGNSAQPSTASYGGYILIIGGVSNNTALSGVYSMQFTAGRQLLPTVPQPSFPTGNDGSSGTVVALDAQGGAPVVVNTGGATTFQGAPVASVYTAALNTTTGSLSAWAAQAALPAAVQNHAMAAAPGGWVYVIGGLRSGATVSSVYYAQVSNGQITGWNAATPLPAALQLSFAAVSNGFMVVAGGADASLNASAATWYAPVNTDGSLGAWIPGPPLATGAYDNGASPAYANDWAVLMDTNANSLTVGASGLSAIWTQDTAGGSGALPGFWDLGNGTVIAYALAPAENLVGVAYDNLLPYPSVPLPATGLTSGATYHLTLQQQGGDLNDYLVTSVGPTVFSASGPTVQTSPPGAYTWTAQATGNAVPIQVFDQTPPTAPGTWPIHTWEDSGVRVSTLVTASTPDKRVMGLCEATAMSSAVNQNTGFETGIAPWTVTGGTVAQSQAEVFTGAYAAQVTPSGSALLVYLTSENLPCMPGQSVTVEARMWFTDAVTAQASMSVNWLTLAGVYISTSSNSVSVPAATWTEFENTFTAPAGAYFYTLNPILGGTPAASQVWYVDAARGYPTTVGPQFSSVIEINYPSGWPGAIFPASGTTVLA